MEKYFRDHPQQKAAYEQRQQEFQKRYELVRRQKSGALVQQRLNAIVTIPVVVHIVMQDPTLVTDDQVQSQIDVLNADYAGNNADSVKIPAAFKSVFGKSQLRFCLAQRTPQNNPSNGIVRTSSTTESIAGEGDPIKYASMGGADSWDPDKYLNIWVCKMSGSTDLGYTFNPGLGIASAELGFVNAYHAFGTIGTATAPFNKGRTATHEIGHYFNLQHIWGANNCTSSCTDSDDVDDTPNQDKCFFGTPVFPQTDACTTISPGVMFMNYMDYSDDAAMCMFTAGQADRMETAITTFSELTPLMTSNGCTPLTLYTNDVEVQKAVSPDNSIVYCNATTITPQLLIRNDGTATLTSVRLNVSVDGGTVVSKVLTVNLATLQTTTISGDAMNVSVGYHTVQLYTTLPNGVADQQPSNDSASSVFSVTGTATAPVKEGFESTFPPAGWGIGNNSGLIDYSPKKVTAAAHSGTASVKFDTYDYQLFGKYSIISTPKITVPVTADSVKVTFWRAAAQASDNIADTLEILYSTDCGQTFSSAYKKGGAQLITRANPQDAEFIPTSSEWVSDTADLTNYVAGKFDNVIVQFRSINGNGNNLYLDDINVYTISLPAVLKQRGYLLAPNPTTGRLTLQNYPSSDKLKGVAVFNSIGQMVWKGDYGSTAALSNMTIDLSMVAPGIYFVKLLYTDTTITQKILKIN
ncbi:MAG: M43 family zinc metalloprotease [Agriterribacter sp.]